MFSVQGGPRQIGIAVGDQIYNLSQAVRSSKHEGVTIESISAGHLNPFIALGKKISKKVRSDVRRRIEEASDIDDFLLPMEKATMHLPVQVGDYTDFYSSIEHATNVGKLYRDPEKALMPNWRHLPVAYHGRSSSIVVSGSEIKRPSGQIKPKAAGTPFYSKTKALDFELETGFIIGKENAIGSSVSTTEARDHIFGMVLLNDWSARDIQKWEYVPLGPFLGKNFATSISPWVVTMEALSSFRVAGPSQEPEVMEYLDFEGDLNIDINLEVSLNRTVVCRSNFKYMYWNMEQQLAHHTVNGCNLRIGDLLGSGTISGREETSYGSLLEISKGGKRSITLDDGSTRTFLEDGDDVVMRGYCEKDDVRVGFGKVRGKIIG